jgi:hypothetical protein
VQVRWVDCALYLEQYGGGGGGGGGQSRPTQLELWALPCGRLVGEGSAARWQRAAEGAGGRWLFGSALALAGVAAHSPGLWSLQDALSPLLQDDSYVSGAFSVDVCTGLCGPAVMGACVVPAAREPALGGAASGAQLFLAQDICVVGPNQGQAAELVVDTIVSQLYELFYEQPSVLLTGLASGGADVAAEPAEVGYVAPATKARRWGRPGQSEGEGGLIGCGGWVHRSPPA